jgi:hypothetical protein
MLTDRLTELTWTTIGRTDGGCRGNRVIAAAQRFPGILYSSIRAQDNINLVRRRRWEAFPSVDDGRTWAGVNNDISSTLVDGLVC